MSRVTEEIDKAIKENEDALVILREKFEQAQDNDVVGQSHLTLKITRILERIDTLQELKNKLEKGK